MEGRRECFFFGRRERRERGVFLFGRVCVFFSGRGSVLLGGRFRWEFFFLGVKIFLFFFLERRFSGGERVFLVFFGCGVGRVFLMGGIGEGCFWRRCFGSRCVWSGVLGGVVGGRCFIRDVFFWEVFFGVVFLGGEGRRLFFGEEEVFFGREGGRGGEGERGCGRCFWREERCPLEVGGAFFGRRGEEGRFFWRGEGQFFFGEERGFFWDFFFWRDVLVEREVFCSVVSFLGGGKGRGGGVGGFFFFVGGGFWGCSLGREGRAFVMELLKKSQNVIRGKIGAGSRTSECSKLEENLVNTSQRSRTAIVKQEVPQKQK